ncbi:MAG: glycerol kinase GlpK [Myxococcota bacterium]
MLAIDPGTTGSTVVVVSPEADILGRATREFPQHFPQAGWVEHDLHEIFGSVAAATEEALHAAGVQARELSALGITNQRETTVLWDRATGKALHRAIVWQDRRTADLCAALKSDGLEPLYRERAGLVLDPYFSGTKLRWLLDHVEGARARAEEGELAFGTMDSWLVWQLSKGAAHVTDVSNASRTLLYDLHEGAFSDALLEPLGVPRAIVPEVRGNAEVYAETRGLTFLPVGIPSAGMAGDQQAALFGQTCFAAGDAKCTYGTGAFLLMNTGTEPVPSRHGLLTTVAWRLGDTTTYALEGSSFVAGAAVQWLRDGLGLVRSAADVERLAAEVEDAGEVVFVPALTGLGAPHWDPHARGLITGLGRDTTGAHLARATLEGIALQIVDLAEAMAADAGRAVPRLRVDGGASRNGLLMQFQADMLDVPVDRPENVETTAMGAAYLAGLGAGVFSGTSAIEEAHRIQITYEPMPGQAGEAARRRKRERWRDAIARTRAASPAEESRS